MIARGGRRACQRAVRADTVQALGQEARARRFANPPHPSEEECMGDAPARNRACERSRDMVLTYEILEGLRAILAGKDQVTHGSQRLQRALPEGEGDGICRGGSFVLDHFRFPGARYVERSTPVRRVGAKFQ